VRLALVAGTAFAEPASAGAGVERAPRAAGQGWMLVHQLKKYFSLEVERARVTAALSGPK
jgi:hypothetical protein